MIVGYQRPETLGEALQLLTDPDAVVIAGGTVVNAATHRAPTVVVDLQALSLTGIERGDGGIRVGAMVTLSEMQDAESVPRVLRDLARRVAPNTIRNVATVGGTIAAAHPLNELVAGLLAFGASISIARTDGTTSYPLEDVLADEGLVDDGIITHVSIQTTGTAASDRTARTPKDTPIVAAVAHSSGAGALRLAMTGVGSTPILVDPSSIQQLDPLSDFRGSKEYRSELAQVLARRVIDVVKQGEGT